MADEASELIVLLVLVLVSLAVVSFLLVRAISRRL
jgi:hypothetical protein